MPVQRPRRPHDPVGASLRIIAFHNGYSHRRERPKEWIESVPIARSIPVHITIPADVRTNHSFK